MHTFTSESNSLSNLSVKRMTRLCILPTRARKSNIISNPIPAFVASKHHCSNRECRRQADVTSSNTLHIPTGKGCKACHDGDAFFSSNRKKYPFTMILRRHTCTDTVGRKCREALGWSIRDARHYRLYDSYKQLQEDTIMNLISSRLQRCYCRL